MEFFTSTWTTEDDGVATMAGFLVLRQADVGVVVVLWRVWRV